jgi:hypothetical protein
MRKHFFMALVTISIVIMSGSNITSVAKAIGAEPVFSGFYAINATNRGEVQMYRIACDVWAEGSGFNRGVLRPWISQIDPPAEIQKPPLEVYTCLGVG